MKNFGLRVITVAGQDVELNIEDELVIADLSEGMDRVAAQMAWWGSVLASAEGEKIEVDAFYRRWRAGRVQEILDKTPSLAEWKVKAAVEADPDFVKMKKAIATAEENAVLALRVFMAFEKKANQLQSRGALTREERAATGLTTPAEPRPRPAASADRVEAMRAANQKNKKKA